MEKRNSWIKGLLMITQLGITMLVPIFLCLFVGLLLNEKLNTVYAVPILLILGMAASFRNAYHLTKTFYAKEKQREDAELHYFEELKSNGKASNDRVCDDRVCDDRASNGKASNDRANKGKEDYKKRR